MRQKAREKIVDGKKYISLAQFMELFEFINTKEVYNEREEGLPCIKIGNSYWYNIEECHSWYAGELKKSPKPLQRLGEKETKLINIIT